MSYNLRKANALFCCVLISAIAFIFSSCSDDDPVVRTESDLVGVWTNSPDHYLYIKSDTKIYSLYLQEYEGETVGMIEPDAMCMNLHTISLYIWTETVSQTYTSS